MRVLMMAAALAMAGQGAVALSCLRTDPAALYGKAAAAEDAYVGVLGVLSFDAGAMPRSHSGPAATPEDVAVAGHLQGRSLGPAGFGAAFDRHVTLEVSCAGPWCPELQNGSRVMAFLRQAGDGYRLALDPCYGWLMPDPAEADVRQVEQCHAGGGCVAQ